MTRNEIKEMKMKCNLNYRKMLIAILLAAPMCAWAGTATINIDVSKAGPKINPHLYGIFLEEINNSVDGGLYAELIANRAFEDSRPPEGCVLKDGRWRSRKNWDTGFDVKPGEVPHWSALSGKMSLETSGGLNTNTPYCLRLDGPASVANEGFWGIGVKAGEKYDLTMFARGAGTLSVRLEDASGAAVSDSETISGIETGWKKFKATLTATKSEAKARFVIATETASPVWLDFVSLFPRKTWKNRWLRPDIAQMVADLKPGFVRWPGGCVVEGGNIESAYNWKQSIGPVEERREAWSAWNHRRTHGIGFLEYLQFCEDIGAEPLWVNFAGMSCLFREADFVPMNEMGWVVTNFLDGVEFATGPSSSPLGALRAKAGHKKPFDLKLVEISNESGTPQFPPRYQLVHEALSSRWPEIKYLADLSWIGRDLMKDCAFDIEDIHIYSSCQWFMSNQDAYANRDPKLPPLYLGEVAVTSPDGGDLKGNILAALSEGAFMMGCERHGDKVSMISYAPLISHVARRNGWHGMIYHDSTRCFGTASYYLWKLFGENRPDYTVQTSVEVANTKKPAITGSIGIGTWDTSAEFKDIRVEKRGELLKLDGAWKDEGGRWSDENGVRRQNDQAVGLSYIGDENWSDYTLTLKARKIKGAEGFLIVFGRKSEEKYWWNIGGWGNAEHGIEYDRSAVGDRVAGKIAIGRWYDIKIELIGTQIRCYLDGKLIHDIAAPEQQRFIVSAGRDAKTGELIIKAINTSDEPITAKLNVAGKGTCTVLKSTKLTDNNSMEEPEKIVPATTRVKITGMHEFPPYSLTVLRIRN